MKLAIRRLIGRDRYMFPAYPCWNNSELYAAIDALMAQAEADEELQAGLEARLASIYSALGDPVCGTILE